MRIIPGSCSNGFARLADLFSPGKESPKDRAWRLELVTVARLLCTRPNQRRATKLDKPRPIYRIDDRKTDQPLAVIGFQLISREYSPESPAPIYADHCREIVKLAEMEGLAAFALVAWGESVWGYAKLPAFFEIDDLLAKAPGNDSIRLIAPESFAAVYRTNRESSIKISS